MIKKGLDVGIEGGPARIDAGSAWDSATRLAEPGDIAGNILLCRLLTSERKYVTYWLHMKPESMDSVFQALAHQSRRKILDLVKSMPGCSVNDIAKYFEVSRIAVMKHLRILEDAQLILTRKSGRTREIYFNIIPIQMIHDRWTTEYSSFWATQVTDLKFALEKTLTDEDKKQE